MRLWHYKLIPYLPRKQLLGQHRECCALRGLGWRKKHKTIDYIFNYPFSYLFDYHVRIMLEMIKRKYKPNSIWFYPHYRGKKIGMDLSNITNLIFFNKNEKYKEHDICYLNECIQNLRKKDVIINIMEDK